MRNLQIATEAALRVRYYIKPLVVAMNTMWPWCVDFTCFGRKGKCQGLGGWEGGIRGRCSSLCVESKVQVHGGMVGRGLKVLSLKPVEGLMPKMKTASIK